MINKCAELGRTDRDTDCGLGGGGFSGELWRLTDCCTSPDKSPEGERKEKHT